MTDFLYLDIETLPTSDPEAIRLLTSDISPPGNYKSAEALGKWETETKPGLVEKAVADTSFHGGYGQVCSIAWAWNDGPVKALSLKPFGVERGLLSDAFFDMARDARVLWDIVIVGHFVADFDLRFLRQRAFVNGVRLPAFFPDSPKAWDKRIADTQHMWTCGVRGEYVSLDDLCRFLGVPPAPEGQITGKDVAREWRAGNYKAVVDHNVEDVHRVRSAHKRMVEVISGLAAE